MFVKISVTMSWRVSADTSIKEELETIGLMIAATESGLAFLILKTRVTIGACV